MTMKTTILTIIAACLLCGFNAFALKPVKEYSAMPTTTAFPGWNEFRIETPDHYHLAAWRLPPKGTDRHITILIAGGDAGNMSNWLALATSLTAHGFTVYTFDYRGFGGSDYFKIDPDHLYYNEFGEDLKAAIKYVRAEMPANMLALYGFSMGTVLAARVWHDAPADYFIGEGFVTDPVAVQQRLFAMKGRTFALPDDAIAHDKKVAVLPDRLLLFAGKQDAITTVTDCESLRANHHGIIIKSFEGGHGGGFSAMMESGTYGEYVNAIIDFTAK